MNDPFNNDDFQDFLHSRGNGPSAELDRDIVHFVQKDLGSEHKIVFAKLLVIQAFVGSLTLLFCPQFEFSFTNNHQLYHYFHYTFGTYICFSVCGALFIGSGAIFAAYLLKKSEIRKIKNSWFFYYLFLSIIAAGVFFFFGANIYLAALGPWLLGAIMGGILMLELNSYFRYFFISIWSI